jgi:hypothetical protein
MPDLWPYDEEALLEATVRRGTGLAASLRRRRRALHFGEVGTAALVVVVSIFALAAPGPPRSRHIVESPPPSTALPAVRQRCPQKTGPADDLVDSETGARFAPVNVICVGSTGAGPGLIAGSYLYFGQQVHSGVNPLLRIVRVSLPGSAGSGAVASPKLNGPLSALFIGGGHLWVVGTVTSSLATLNLLYELSPKTLALEHRFDISSQFVAVAAGRLWVADGNGVAPIDPRTGERAAMPISGMSPSAAVFGLAGTGTTLYVYAQGGNLGGGGALFKLASGTGVSAEVRAGGYVQSLEGVAGGVLWVMTAGGMVHGVRAYSTATLQPLAGAFGAAAPNGTWSA